VSAPHPSTVERMAVDIAAKSKTACLDYGWLYKSAYQRGGNPTERGSKQRHSSTGSHRMTRIPSIG
jgi:hypothetical protein